MTKLGYQQGDPVYRARKMFEREIKQLKELIDVAKASDMEYDCEEIELEHLQSELESLNSCFS